MQFNGWDPLVFIIVCLGFFVFFITFMYSKRMLWFQQDSANETDNWFVSFEARDVASGGWSRRFGRPVIVLYLANLISYQVVTNLFVLAPFQLFIYVIVFYIPTNVILVIILIIIHWRIYRTPKVRDSKPIEDPFSDASSGN